MQLEKLVAKVSERTIDCAQIYRNPDNLSQWFVMVKTTDKASHLLVDELDKPITRMNIEGLFSLLRQAGLKSAEVIF